MKIYKIYCDYCGKLQSVSDSKSRRMYDVNVKSGVDSKLEFQMCNNCLDILSEHLERIKENIVAKELSVDKESK